MAEIWAAAIGAAVAVGGLAIKASDSSKANSRADQAASQHLTQAEQDAQDKADYNEGILSQKTSSDIAIQNQDLYSSQYSAQLSGTGSAVAAKQAAAEKRKNYLLIGGLILVAATIVVVVVKKSN